MNNKKDKKSRLFLIGSFLTLLAGIFFFLPLLLELRKEVFSEMQLKMYAQQGEDETPVTDANLPAIENLQPTQEGQVEKPTIQYQYIGYLQIPKIGLYKGFVSKNSKYNNIEYNVTIAETADYPNKEKGNFILMAHSGYGYLAFFDNLYQLELGDLAKVNYKDKTYTYQLVNVYLQDKTGKVAIFRNFDVKTLTLITCTHEDDLHQSIYIFEQV